MGDWDRYVRQFYALTSERQLAEWGRLTPGQKAAFRAAHSRLSQTGPRPSGRGWTLPQIAAVGCAGLAALGILCFTGLAMWAGSTGDTASKVVEQREREPASDADDPGSVLGDLGSKLDEPEPVSDELGPAPRFQDLEYHRADGDPEKIVEFILLTEMIGRTGALHNCDEFKWRRPSDDVYIAMCGRDDTTDIPRYWMVFPNLDKVNGPFQADAEIP